MCKKCWISQNFVEFSEASKIMNDFKELIKTMPNSKYDIDNRALLKYLNLENDLLNSELNLSFSIHDWVRCIK